ncbi:TonB-dependent receptor domain-containing protein [Sphingomonas metalli]|uniref:TonB-dependent receptor domain-containing protein n=1 Tax=Sphingomonas metalli TaxID=1779358 RepID=UPI0016668917|nr:TonB-dependent receptor [Sphingomonas metalli]
MTKQFGLSALLLLSTGLVAPAALAQTTGSGTTTGTGGATGAPPRASTPDAGRTQTSTPDAGVAQTQDGNAPGTQEQPVDISAPGAMEDIVVVGRNVPDLVRRTPEVVSVLSTADIARTGEGDIAGALSRVTGLSVVGNGFVYVRGLGDRYSLALLNGSQLPSPEPLRRSIPLDIFPTSVLASALVQKSYSVNYPGEFGGGVINLTTRAVPDKPFLSINVSGSGDTETTGLLGYTYYGSPTDWTGFDNGTRSTPAPLAAALSSGNLIVEGQNFTRRQIQDINASLVNARTTVVQRNGDIPANFAIDVNGGFARDIGDVRIGIIAAAGLSNTWRTRDATQQFSGGFVNGELTPTVDFRAVLTDNRIVANGLLGVGAEFGENRIRWTNLYIRDTIKQTRLARGTDAEGFDGTTPIIDQNTRWFERQLIDTQLVSEFKFDDFGLDFRGSYANSQRESPYERTFRYLFDSNVGDFVNNLGQAGSARVSFSDLNENAYSAGVDLSYKLPTATPITLTAGYAFNDNRRNSVRRDFRFLSADGALPSTVAQERPDYLLSDYNIYTYNILLQETSGQSGAAAYDAGLRVHAGYGQIVASVLPGVSVNIGVRYENGRQFVTPLELSGRPSTSVAQTTIKKEYWLPAGTVTWNLAEDMQFRVNASKTLARPQFRELAFQVYQDPEGDRLFFGNPFLVDTELKNVEARYEWYFGRDQRLTLGGFFKRIDNPIETFAFRSTGQLQTSFANAPSADLYGGEVEVQKYVPLDNIFSGDFFASRRLLLNANYTYTKSKLRVSEGDRITFADGTQFDARDFFRDGAPLTGQSDHLVNFQIGLDNKERVSQQTILVNYASKRVTNRGPAGTPQQPDIVEEPGVRLDFVAREEADFLGKVVEIKFEVRNILGTRFQEFQTAGDRRIDINTYDLGTSFSLGAGVRF